MKTFTSILRYLSPSVVISAVSLFAGEPEAKKFPTLNLGDRWVTNAYVSKVTPLEVIILWDGGGGKRFKRQDSPPQLKELYPYDAAEAKRFQDEQERERRERVEEERGRQKGIREEYKNTLRQKRQVLETQVASLETELNKVNQQIDGYRRRVRRRRTAGEVQDIARLEAQARDLKSRISMLRDKIRASDWQLSL